MHLNENNDVLDLVDQLRSQGISHYIDLPQIIVCGDQSSGKSSVLEAISGLQFPRKDNLCTRFATEVILRRSLTEHINASIVPADDRPEDDRDRLSKFKRSGFQAESLELLVEEARHVMGIDGDKRSFSNDVLRIELSGPKQPHLTLVDLPGLFSAGNKAQSESEGEAVRSLVLSYMRNPRSIILAVVSAKNDFANQIVTKYTRDVDVRGTRTLGIITKPDTLHSGSDSERSYLVLAKNEDVYFRLGWHVLRNRDFDTHTVSADQRDQLERDFFAKGAWTELTASQVGIDALRPRLSHVLRQQILVELPSLLADVQEGLEECKKKLSHMGAARATTGDQRVYLLRISQEFTFLVRSAIEGSYLDGFFGSAASENGYKRRLRAVVQNESLAFADRMRKRGHAKHIVDTVTQRQSRKDPRLISKDEYIDSVLLLMTRSRGRELPGTYNPHIIGDLFSEQSKPWQALVHSFIIDVWDATQTTLRLILDHVADLHTTANLQQTILQPALNSLKDSLDEAISIVLEHFVTGHPITYNHYLTDNIQKLRAERQRASLSQKLDQFFGTNAAEGITHCERKSFDVNSLLQTLTQTTIADMDRYACSEATDVMKAYYKVAIKTCIDDVAHTIERVLLSRLPNLLSPQIMMALDDATVNGITAESGDVQQERAKLVHKQNSLDVAYAALRTLNQSQTSGIGAHHYQDSVTSGVDRSSPESDDDDDDDDENDETVRFVKGTRRSRTSSNASERVSDPTSEILYGSEPELEVDAQPHEAVHTHAADENDDWEPRNKSPDSSPYWGPTVQTKKSKKKKKSTISNAQTIDHGNWFTATPN